MKQRLAKAVVTLAVISALPMGAAMAGEVPAQPVDTQQASLVKIARMAVMPKVVVECYIDDYTMLFPTRSAVTSTYYYDNYIGGSRCKGTLDLSDISEYLKAVIGVIIAGRYLGKAELYQSVLYLKYTSMY